MKALIYLVYFLLLVAVPAQLYAQCTSTGSTTLTSCTNAWFTSISAAGAGVTSTVAGGSTSCTGTYFNYYSTRGITAPTGSTVNMTITKTSAGGYTSNLYVYVDWDNDGNYTTSELVGSMMVLSPGTGHTANYNFTIPMLGIVTNTNLHMRVYHTEPAYSFTPPCSGRYGEADDYFLRATCTAPSIAVTPASPTICLGNTVTLNASGAGATPYYIWSPSAGLSVTTVTSVIASPAANTTYKVLGYGPGVCLDSTTVPVTVTPAVTATVSATGATTFCRGGSVLLSETSGTGIAYQWYAGATAIAGATNSTYTASPTATTTYSVVTTNSAGCTATAGLTVTILPTPVAMLSASAPTVLCSPATVTLTAPSGAGYTYQWFDGGALMSGVTGTSYTVTASGAFRVVITGSNGCRDTSLVTTVAINPSPVASATASAVLTVCANDSVVLTALSGYTYQWLNGVTPLSGATNRVFVARTPGTYNYRVVVTNSFGCTDTTASGLFPVTVNPVPVATVTATGATTFCTGSSVLLSVPNVFGYTYQWFSGPAAGTGSPIAGATGSGYTATASAYYYAQVTTPAGCTSSSVAAPVRVTAITVPAIQYTTPTVFCEGSSVLLSLSIPSGASGITFQWKRNTINIPGATNNTYTATAAGTYTCFINIGSTCVTTTTPATVVVHPLPNPIISRSGNWLSTGNYYVSYQWYRNLTPISGATTSRVWINDTGNYKVFVRDTNACIMMSTALPLSYLGVVDVSEADIRVSPIPTTDFLNIDATVPVTACISSADGRQLITVREAKHLDVSTLPAGVYLLTLTTDDGRRLYITKVVKE